MAQTILTANPGVAQTLAIDATWNKNANTIELVAGGGTGSATQLDTTTAGDASGGGGGEYRKISNYLLSNIGGAITVDYLIGSAGAAAATTVGGGSQRVAGSKGQVTLWDPDNFQIQSQFASGWTPTHYTLTANTVTAPNGTTTAAKIVEDNVASVGHLLLGTANSTDIVPGATYSVSVYVKLGAAGSSRRLYLSLCNSAGSSGIDFVYDIVNGALVSGQGSTFGSGYAFSSAAIGTDSLATGNGGNGWFRASLVGTTTTAITELASYVATDNLTGQAARVATYSGDGVSGLQLWGAQITLGSTLRPYTATTTTSLISAEAIGGGAGASGLTGGGVGGTGGRADGGSSPVTRAGGRGGNCTGTTATSATGGGGAGGPTAAGAQGVDVANGTLTGSNGGAADVGGTGAGTAGTGTTASPGGAGGAGTEFSGSAGCGGGGGGCRTSTNAAIVGGLGGNYGSGSGGAQNSGTGGNASTKATSGAAKQGVIVVTWTPIAWFGDNEFKTTQIKTAPQTRQRRAAVKGSSQFGVYTPFVDHGFPIQPPQPPFAPMLRKRAAAIRGRVEFVYFKYTDHGWPIQPPQPPNPAVRNRARAGSAIRSRSEHGYPIGDWIELGFEQVTSQPKVFHARKQAVLEVGDWGNQAPYVFTPPVSVLGDFTYDENRFLRRPRPGAAIMRGDDGNQNRYQFWINVGSEVQPPQPPHPIVRQRSAGIIGGDDPGNDGRFIFWTDLGWPIQPVQPVYRRLGKASAVLEGDDGIQGPFQPPAAPPLGDFTYDENRYLRLRQRGVHGLPNLAGGDVPNPPLVQWVNAGWEVQPPQPPAFRRKFSLVGNDGIDNVFTLTPAAAITWWESNIADLRFLRRMQSLVGDDGIQGQYVSWLNSGFEPVLFQPPHPKPEARFAGLVGGDFGAWNPFAFTDHGWPAIYPQPPHPRPERSGAIARGDDGNQAIYQALLIPYNWGMEVAPFQPPAFNPRRFAGLIGGDFGAWRAISFTDHGWPAIYPQPPYRLAPQRGAFLRGDDGNQGLFQLVTIPHEWGFEIQPVQPPAFTRPRRQAGTVGGDFGAWQPFVFVNHGWPANYPQPPYRISPQRSAANMRGDDGITAIFQAVTIPFNWGFDPQPFQPPAFTRARRGVAIRSEDGIQAPYVSWRNFGFEPWLGTPSFSRPYRLRAAGTVGGDFGAWQPFPFVAHGWPIAPFQPPHPRRERFGSLVRGDDGNLALYQFLLIAHEWGFEIAPVQPPHPRPERSGALARWDDGMGKFVASVPYILWFASPEFQPPKHRWLGIVAATKGKAPFAVYPPFTGFGWDIAPFQPPYRSAPQKIEGTRGKTLFAIFRGQLYGGWESNPFQPPHPRPEQRGASIRFRSGYAVYPPFPDYGFWVDQPQPPHPRPERSGAIQRGDDGTQAAFNLNAIPYNWGFDPQAFQPPAFTLPRRGTAITKDDGIQGVYVNWQNVGSWEQLPEQPPRLRYEKAGAIAVGDVGAWDTFQPWTSVGFEPWLGTPSYAQPQRLRAAAIMRGDDGNALSLAQWINAGWEIQSVQPPHPKPEQRFAGLVGGDVGVDTYHRFFDYGWFVSQPQPPHPRPERWAAIARGDDGNEFPYVQFQVLHEWGFELPPWQPPHPRWKRAAGAHHKTSWRIFPVWRNSGWEFVTSQPRHPRPERSGAIARWEPANYNRFQLLPTIPHEWGYEPNPFQPPRRKWERAAGMRGARGGFAIYPPTVISVGAFTPAIPDVRILFKHRSYRMITDETYDKFVFVPVRGFDGWKPVLPDVRWPKVRHHFDADTNNNGPHRVLVVFPPDFWVTVPPRCTTAVATARQLIVLAQPRCIVAYAEPD